MKRRTALLAGLACLLVAGRAARAADGVEISYANGLLTVRCAHARLATVLERIGSATGTEVVLDDSVKGTLLTADVEAQPVSVALERVLEGLGVTYAMSLSLDGRRVSRMYIGTGGGHWPAASLPAPPSLATSAIPAADVDETDAGAILSALSAAGGVSKADPADLPVTMPSPITFEALMGRVGRPTPALPASPAAPARQEKPAPLNQ